METRFTGSVPSAYDELMVPLLFAPYAKVLASRAREFGPSRILETAAGTGALTEALRNALPDAEIVATDLNQAMIEMAATRDLSEVTFRRADALDLPFDDSSFDLVVCQFGMMFFPDKVQGAAEAHRVLRDGGHYLLAIWDRIERNPLTEIAQQVLIDSYPDHPPLFMREGPFGYHDPVWIEADLNAGGFGTVEIETIELRSRSPSAREAARALCNGTPMGSEIADRGPDALEHVLAAVEQAFERLEGPGGIDLPMAAHVVAATR